MKSTIDYLNNMKMTKSPSLLSLEEEDPSVTFHTGKMYEGGSVRFYKDKIKEARHMFKNMCYRYDINAEKWFRKPTSQRPLLAAYDHYTPTTPEEHAALLKKLHMLFYKAENYYKDFEREYCEEVRQRIARGKL
jgi:hypothetical protein